MSPMDKPEMNLLVINCGSSSIKYQLLDMTTETWRLKGLLENIGATAKHRVQRSTCMAGEQAQEITEFSCADIASALQHMATTLQPYQAQVHAIVHRVVHGGALLSAPLRLSKETVEALRPLNALAPLHNPANLQGIELCEKLFPAVTQFAVFDTAFHSTLPPQAYRYAIPASWHALGVRRYGFHGNSHLHVARKAAQSLRKPLHACNLITLHLGNGASVTAIAQGKSVDTSMGFTPLEGLVMGSRGGDLDSGIPGFISTQTGKPLAAIEHDLWHESGLKGLAGCNDMRQLQARADQGDADAALAIDLFCYRARKYIGAYLAVLGQVDAIVFTGGIGENAALIRERIAGPLRALSIYLDSDRNKQVNLAASPSNDGGCEVASAPDSPIAVLVIATNEELEMAQQVADLLAVEG